MAGSEFGVKNMKAWIHPALSQRFRLVVVVSNGVGDIYLIMDVQPTNLQQLRDAIMSTWIKISEECFQHLVESMPRRIKAVLKAKGGPTLY